MVNMSFLHLNLSRILLVFLVIATATTTTTTVKRHSSASSGATAIWVVEASRLQAAVRRRNSNKGGNGGIISTNSNTTTNNNDNQQQKQMEEEREEDVVRTKGLRLSHDFDRHDNVDPSRYHRQLLFLGSIWDLIVTSLIGNGIDSSNDDAGTTTELPMTTNTSPASGEEASSSSSRCVLGVNIYCKNRHDGSLSSSSSSRSTTPSCDVTTPITDQTIQLDIINATIINSSNGGNGGADAAAADSLLYNHDTGPITIQSLTVASSVGYPSYYSFSNNIKGSTFYLVDDNTLQPTTTSTNTTRSQEGDNMTTAAAASSASSSTADDASSIRFHTNFTIPVDTTKRRGRKRTYTLLIVLLASTGINGRECRASQIITFEVASSGDSAGRVRGGG